MFIKPAQRKYLKNCLLIANTLLGIIFVGLLIYGLMIVRPNMLAQTTARAQYFLLDLNNLPQSLDTIQPDYIGRKNNEATGEIDTDQDDNETKLLSVSQDEIPKVAILITNLGLSKRINDLVLKLPAQISLGIIPYSLTVQTFISEAQSKGHEIYISLPSSMVTDVQNEHGEENMRKLNNWFSADCKYKGIYISHTNGNDNSCNFEPLLNQIANKDLLLVLGILKSSNEYKKSENSMNIIQPDFIIDLEADAFEIKKNLEQLVEHAKANKKALGYANGYLLTIEMINEWLPLLESQGVELVPVSSFEDKQK